MTKKVSEDQNTMYYEDRVYEACEVLTNSCTGCDFCSLSGCNCPIVGSCASINRKDKRIIIWKLKDNTYNYSTRAIRLLKV